MAWAVGRSGNPWLAHRLAYRFYEVTFGGDTIRTVELGDPPPPYRHDVDVPDSEYKPVIESIDVSPEWDLFDHCGRYRGAVAAPDALASVTLGREGAVYGVVSDAFDVDYVLRLRLEGRDGARATAEACPF